MILNHVRWCRMSGGGTEDHGAAAAAAEDLFSREEFRVACASAVELYAADGVDALWTPMSVCLCIPLV